MSGEIWLFCPLENGALTLGQLALVQTAKALSSQTGGEIAAAVPLPTRQEAPLIPAGVDKLRLLPTGGSEYVMARALAEAAKRHHPDILLFCAGAREAGIAASTAALLGTGLTADCTSLSITSDGHLLQTRPAYGGGLVADILCAGHRPQMATVRTSRGGAKNVPLTTCPAHAIFREEITPTADPIKLLGTQPAGSIRLLHESRVIVAGGRGVGSKKGFELLRQLADALGGDLAASRSAVDAGYAGWECQVGQTGQNVAPALYIAFGLSGAPQHVAGITNAGYIIAVNTDPRAPIFDYADLAMVADWEQTARQLLKNIQKKENGHEF